LKARLKWIEGLQFIAQPGSGHGVIVEGYTEQSDKPSAGPRPMEMLLMGLGGCAGIDVVLILEKSRENITDCIVDVEAQRSDEIPSVFTDIHMIFTVTGYGLSQKKVENAVRLSAEKYCSASLMLGKACTITRETRIIDTRS
jgi:putative redox protein